MPFHNTTHPKVGDSLPFLEYDLHRQLMGKLKVRGFNAVFGLRVKVSVSDTLMVAVATGTAVHLASLPMPPVLQILQREVCRCFLSNLS